MKSIYIPIASIFVWPLVAQASDHTPAYKLVAEYTSDVKVPGPVYAIDIDENHQYVVATSSGHHIEQYVLEQHGNEAPGVKKIYPNYIYAFPSSRERSEYYITCGAGESSDCFYVQGLTGAWFKWQKRYPLGITKGIESETVLLWNANSIDENSTILVGDTVAGNTTSPAVVLNTLKGDVVRTYLLNNNGAIQSQVGCLAASSDKKYIAAGINGQLLCALWNFETGASEHVVKNNKDENQLCQAIVSIPKTNNYCISSSNRLMRYNVNSNELDTLHTFDHDMLSGMAFLDDTTLVVGSYSGIIRIFDLRKLDNQPTSVVGPEGVAINAIRALNNRSFLTSRDDGVVAQWQAQ